MIRFLKGIIGLCQCEGCMNRHTSKMTMMRRNGTIYHIYVCEDCSMEIYQISKIK